MIRVTTVVRTCTACPDQWEGITDDNRQIYARGRHGYLEIRVGPIGDMSRFAAVTGALVLSNDNVDDFMTYAELQAMTSGIIEWPATESDAVTWQVKEAPATLASEQKPRKLPPRPIKAGMRVGSKAALRASYDEKCLCRTCMYLLTSCEGVTVAKGLRHGMIIILDCNGYQRELLTPREIEALKEKEATDAIASV